MLATTDLSLAIIAEMIGYAHTEYFSTVFRKKVGVSPSEFRGRIQTD
ncbi:MAG: AraC family transcriptional regulator [Verrucomicrobia bacterium]|nr:AraC family transcriptional regulator [Verrucomicrobiota bacterium]